MIAALFAVRLPASFSQAQWALPSALAEIAEDGDFAFVEEIIDIFVADAQSKIVDLRDAILHGNREAVGRLSHSVKGAASQVGLSRLSDVALRLEREFASRDPSPLQHATTERWASELDKSWAESEQIMALVRESLGTAEAA